MTMPAKVQLCTYPQAGNPFEKLISKIGYKNTTVPACVAVGGGFRVRWEEL